MELQRLLVLRKTLDLRFMTLSIVRMEEEELSWTAMNFDVFIRRRSSFVDFGCCCCCSNLLSATTRKLDSKNPVSTSIKLFATLFLNSAEIANFNFVFAEFEFGRWRMLQSAISKPRANFISIWRSQETTLHRRKIRQFDWLDLTNRKMGFSVTVLDAFSFVLIELRVAYWV